MKQIGWLVILTFLASCSTVNVKRNGYYQTIKYKNKKHSPRKNLLANTSKNLFSFIEKEGTNWNNKQVFILLSNGPNKFVKVADVQFNTEEYQIKKRFGIALNPQNNMLKNSIGKVSNSIWGDVKQEIEPEQSTLQQSERNVRIENTTHIPIILNTIFSVNDTSLNPSNETRSSKLGSFFIVLGIFICIASLFFIFGYPTFENLFRILVLSGNGFFVGLLGFLLFVLIVISLALIVQLLEVIGGATIGFVLGSLFIIMGLIVRKVEIQD